MSTVTIDKCNAYFMDKSINFFSKPWPWKQRDLWPLDSRICCAIKVQVHHLKQNFILDLQRNRHELLAAWRRVWMIYTDYDSKYAEHNQQSKAVMYVCM